MWPRPWESATRKKNAVSYYLAAGAAAAGAARARAAPAAWWWRVGTRRRRRRGPRTAAPSTGCGRPDEGGAGVGKVPEDGPVPAAGRLYQRAPTTRWCRRSRSERARWRPRSSAPSARTRRRSPRVRVGAVGEQSRHVGGLPFQAALNSSSFITGCELAEDSPAVSGCRGASASRTFFLVRSPWTSLTSVQRRAGKPVSKGAIQVTATQHVVACTPPPQRRLPPLRFRQLLQPCDVRCAACGERDSAAAARCNCDRERHSAAGRRWSWTSR